MTPRHALPYPLYRAALAATLAAGALFPALLLALFPAVARADAKAGEAKASTCMVCHGPQGKSTDASYPVLAGQTSRYIYLELRDFKEGRRSDPSMTPVAAQLSRDDMQDLADYFSSQTPFQAAYKGDTSRVKAGSARSAEILCTMCHLGGFTGQNEIPRVAGQHYAYIVKQLEDFRARRRTNDAGNMTSVARNLSDDDIKNLASYIANLN